MTESAPKRAPRKKPEETAEAATPTNSVSPVTETSVTGPDVSSQPEALAEKYTAPIVQQPAPGRPYAVVGNTDTDPVYLSKIVYRNIAARKSLSVHHLQRRLNELGYTEAYADKDGYYGDLTKAGIERFQSDHDLLVTGIVDQGTLAAIFDGDPNVSVHLV